MDIKLGSYSFSKFGLTLIVVVLSKFSSSIAMIMSASVSSVSSEIQTVFLKGEIPENEFGQKPSALWCISTTLNMSKQETNDVSSSCGNLKNLRTSNLRSSEDWSLRKTNFLKIVITMMNTDDMLIVYSNSARELVDSFEKRWNDSSCLCFYKTVSAVTQIARQKEHPARHPQQFLASIGWSSRRAHAQFPYSEVSIPGLVQAMFWYLAVLAFSHVQCYR